MTKTLKQQTTSAFFWNFMDKGGQQLFQFLFLLILASLLAPQEWGLIALIAIFPAVANIIQESGFSSALIRKINADETDYSSIFYFNITTSFIIYAILFVLSPFIAVFYNEPILTKLSRILFLTFLFNAFGLIQNVHLVKRMDFKTNAWITLTSVILSGLIAILMAYYGFGVWSLVWQQVGQAFFRMVLLWVVVKWHPTASFSIDRLRSMYNYSFKLLLNSLFNQISANISSIVIGKRYSITDAGYYWQAYKIGNIPQAVVASSLAGVAFPLLNNLGDNIERKKRIFRKIVRVVCFICFPLAAFTIVAADSIVLVFLREKWADIIPILRLFTIGSSVLPLLYLITSLLQSLGKSGVLLSMELVRNIATILVILVMSSFGINEMVLGISIVYILAFFCEYAVAGKYIDYKITEILKDVLPYMFIAAISFLPLHLFSLLTQNHLALLILEGIVGTGIYLVILKLLGSKVSDDFIRMIKKRSLN